MSRKTKTVSPFSEEDIGFPVDAQITTNGKTAAFLGLDLCLLVGLSQNGDVNYTVIGKVTSREEAIRFCSTIVSTIARKGILLEALIYAGIREQEEDEAPVTETVGRLIRKHEENQKGDEPWKM